MVSETFNIFHDKHDKEVLILIVVEYGLGEGNKKVGNGFGVNVLILIVVEYGLGVLS